MVALASNTISKELDAHGLVRFRDISNFAENILHVKR